VIYNYDFARDVILSTITMSSIYQTRMAQALTKFNQAKVTMLSLFDNQRVTMDEARALNQHVSTIVALLHNVNRQGVDKSEVLPDIEMNLASMQTIFDRYH